MPDDDGTGGTPGDHPDTKLYEALRCSPSAAPVWVLTRNGLLEQVLPHLHHLVLSDRLRAEARRQGCPVSLTAEELGLLRDDRGQRTDLVNDAALRYLESFEAGIRADTGWRPGAGRSMATYALAGSACTLVGRIRAWQRRRHHEASTAPGDLTAGDARPAPAPGPEDVVASRDELAGLLELARTVDPALVPALLERTRSGRSWDAVAPEVGLAATTLRRRVRSLRDLLHRPDPPDPPDRRRPDPCRATSWGVPR